MRETSFSNCERDFILDAVTQRQRLDGRGAYDYRRICITFGIDRGCCQVQMGNTRVMAQVSCEVAEPTTTRPTDGIVRVNVELSPMAAPHFEAGRMSDLGVEINRLLERCIRESRCVDTESLCIMAGIKVWIIRVDVHVLNHDGNIVDCSSIAAISALAHFRRPDVTVSGEDVTIHTTDERDPVPLSIHHMPICVTFAFFDQGKYLLVDPLEREERVMDGKMVIGMNKHREICTFQMTGSMLLLRDQVLRCSNVAVVKVTEITELIQKALENDALARSSGEKFGFAASVLKAKVTVSEATPEPVDVDDIEEETQKIMAQAAADFETIEAEEEEVIIKGPGTAQIGEGGTSTWDLPEEEVEEKVESETTGSSVLQQPTTLPSHKREDEHLSGDSEEEETVTLRQEDLQYEKSKFPSDMPGGKIDLSMALKKPKQSNGQKMKTKVRK